MAGGFVPSRRQIVLGGAALAAIAPLSGSSVAFGATKPLALHDLDDWQRHVGTKFALGTAPLSLIAVEAGKRQPAWAKRRSNFTAIFEMDVAAAPAAGIHQIAHPELGQTALYIEPTDINGGKMRMHATFN